MTEMRRLDVPKKGDLFERGHTSPVRAFEIERAEFERVERERPELLVASDAGLALLQPKGSRAFFHCAFDSVEAFRREFQPMFVRLMNALKPDEFPTGIYVRFTDLPNRPYVEPILDESLFALYYEWMEMDLVSLPEEPVPSDEVAPGFVLRPMAAGEYDAFAAVDAAAFERDTWSPADFADAVAEASQMRMLEERETGRSAGYVTLQIKDGRVGKIRLLAVHPDFQRRGLAEAMTRWSLAWLRNQGMRRATLNVRVDNPGAVALYRKLGFVPGRRGLMYRRPTTKRELDEIASKRKGTYIKFGGWR